MCGRAIADHTMAIPVCSRFQENSDHGLSAEAASRRKPSNSHCKQLWEQQKIQRMSNLQKPDFLRFCLLLTCDPE
jgi:hypothetical protein